MIYKMELSDSFDTMIFPLLEVPIEDKDVSGIASNTTIDGNVFNDYLWLKKQYVQKWSIMCQDEYNRLRGFWTRQFGNAEVPFYRLFYGEDRYEDREGFTVNGFVQIDNMTDYLASFSLTQLLGNTTQETLSGKNLLSLDNTFERTYPSGLTYTQEPNSVDITADITTGAQYVRYIVGGLDATKDYTFSFKAKKVVKGTDGRPYIRVQTYGSDNGTDWTGLHYYENSNPTQGTEYSGSIALTGYAYYRIAFYNNTYTPVSIGERTQYYDIQLEEGTQATDFEPYVGGTASPNPDYPQDVNVVSGEQTAQITGKNILKPMPKTVSSGGITLDWKENGNIEITGTTTGTAWLRSSREAAQEFDAYLAQGTYTFSVKGNTIGASFRLYDESLGYIAVATTQAGVSFTISEPTKVGLQIKIASGTATNITAQPQLELGSTATDYEAYQGQSYTIDLGSNEFAKIGDYRDYIWNDNGTWKIHKEVGKVVLDGSQAVASTAFTSLFFIQESIVGIYIDGGFSDHFTFVSDSHITGNSPANNYLSDNQMAFRLGEAKDRLYIKSSQFASNTDLRIWLSTHNTTVYYALATPTDTEITDSELVAQLDALLAGSLYKGTNNLFLIPSGGAQGEMRYKYRLIYEKETDIIPKTPVILTLTDGGVINACGCRQNIQLIMRETKESTES